MNWTYCVRSHMYVNLNPFRTKTTTTTNLPNLLFRVEFFFFVVSADLCNLHHAHNKNKFIVTYEYDWYMCAQFEVDQMCWPLSLLFHCNFSVVVIITNYILFWWCWWFVAAHCLHQIKLENKINNKIEHTALWLI